MKVISLFSFIYALVVFRIHSFSQWISFALVLGVQNFIYTRSRTVSVRLVWWRFIHGTWHSKWTLLHYSVYHPIKFHRTFEEEEENSDTHSSPTTEPKLSKQTVFKLKYTQTHILYIVIWHMLLLFWLIFTFSWYKYTLINLTR